jgi:hypothetical protein
MIAIPHAPRTMNEGKSTARRSTPSAQPMPAMKAVVAARTNAGSALNIGWRPTPFGCALLHHVWLMKG